MDWAAIVPSLIIGGFFGWLYGAVQGHSETQTLLQVQERRLHKLLALLHQGQAYRRDEMDLVMGLLTEQGSDKEWFWRAWKRQREEQIEEQTDEKTGFFAEMHKGP